MQGDSGNDGGNDSDGDSETTIKRRNVCFLIFAICLTTGTVFIWKSLIDDWIDFENDMEKYDDNCVSQFECVCKDENIIPKNVENDFFDHDTGVVTSDFLKVLIARGDCKIFNKKTDNLEDFCTETKRYRIPNNKCCGCLLLILFIFTIFVVVLDFEVAKRINVGPR